MSLAGRGIVVTRPRELAQGLAELIRRAEGEPILFPALAIRNVPEPSALRHLEDFELAIFISPTAVAKVMSRVAAWPQRLRVAAVGSGTGRELERRGISGVIVPDAGTDSEALLALSELERVAGTRVVIFRGQEGRTLLGDTLKARGARVEYAECYRRVRPEANAAPLLEAWARGAVHAVTVSSREGLENLFAMLGAPGERWLRATPLFVPHRRIAAHAARLGVREAVVAGPGDRDMIDRLVAYFAT